jgi:hypothetical protein
MQSGLGYLTVGRSLGGGWIGGASLRAAPFAYVAFALDSPSLGFARLTAFDGAASISRERQVT